MCPRSISFAWLILVAGLNAEIKPQWTVGSDSTFNLDAVQSSPLLQPAANQLFFAGNRFFNTSDGSPAQSYANPVRGSALAFNNHLYVVGSHDNAYIYDGNSDELRATLNAQDEPRSLGPDAVSCAAFSPDQAMLVTGGFKQVKIWRWSENKLLGTIPLPYHAIATKVGITADGEYLVI